MSEGKEIKTTHPKKIKKVYPVSANKVAKAVGCSPRTVKAIRSGERNIDTPVGKRIQVAEELYCAGYKLVDKEVIKRVQRS